MNRYLCEGMIRDALAGKRVIVLGRMTDDEWEIFTDAAEAVRVEGMAVSRQRRKVTWMQEGGYVQASQTTKQLEGRTADVVVVYNRHLGGMNEGDRLVVQRVLGGVGSAGELVWL